ncbi:hypothetical protein D9M73_295790 [compost metagenome]
MQAQVAKKNSAVASRAASAALSQLPKPRIISAPIQNTRGPSSLYGRPTIFGISQSCRLPVASCHMTPKPAASSFFHGSRPNRPTMP